MRFQVSLLRTGEDAWESTITRVDPGPARTPGSSRQRQIRRLAQGAGKGGAFPLPPLPEVEVMPDGALEKRLCSLTDVGDLRESFRRLATGDAGDGATIPAFSAYLFATLLGSECWAGYPRGGRRGAHRVGAPLVGGGVRAQSAALGDDAWTRRLPRPRALSRGRDHAHRGACCSASRGSLADRGRRAHQAGDRTPRAVRRRSGSQRPRHSLGPPSTSACCDTSSTKSAACCRSCSCVPRRTTSPRRSSGSSPRWCISSVTGASRGSPGGARASQRR